MGEANGTLAMVRFPLTSPIVMLMRICLTLLLWQIAISLTLLFATFFGGLVCRKARVGILMYGKSPAGKSCINGFNINSLSY
jgi:ABC-2 type transport system permease protein